MCEAQQEEPQKKRVQKIQHRENLQCQRQRQQYRGLQQHVKKARERAYGRHMTAGESGDPAPL
jgi:hypothetical protein